MTETTSDAQAQALRLVRVIEEAGEDEAGSLLAWILLALLPGMDVSALPPRVLSFLSTLSQTLGVSPQTSGEEMKAALERFYQAFPLAPGLMNQVVALLADDEAVDVAAVGAAFGRLLGSEAGRGVLQRTAPPPEGAVAAGPLARFQAQDVATKKDG